MADNKAIIDGAGASFQGAADELADGSFSPKISILPGDATATPIYPATSVADDAAFTPASGRVTMIGAFADDSGPDSVNEGDGGAVRMSLRRELYVQLRDAAGNERGLNVDASGQIAVVPAATEVHLGAVGSPMTNPTANFTRPADTTAYATGDLVANSTTAGSVAAMSLTVGRVTAGAFMLRRLKLHKSGTGTTNASFRVHLFRAAPGTVTNGDNGAFSVSGVADYLGAFDVTIDRAFTDGAAGFGTPVAGSEMSIKLASGSTIAALIEARAAYTPASAEVFTVTLDNLQS